MEVYLHEMLTQGYTTVDGTKIAPWQLYTDVIAMYQSSRGDGLNAKIPEDAVTFEEYAWPEEYRDVKYQMRKLNDGTKYTLVDAVEINAEGITDADAIGRKARIYMRAKYRKKVLPVGKTKSAYIKNGAINEYTNPRKFLSDADYHSKMVAATELENLLKYSTYLRWRKDDGHHPEAVRGWNYYKTIFAVTDAKTGAIKVFEGEIQIKRIARGDLFHDITQIKEITNDTIGQSIIMDAKFVGDTSSVAQNVEDVKRSLRQTETPEFKRWFEDSKIINADGTPKLMYHGTPYGGFTVFKDWQYFTDIPEYADKYHEPSASSIRGRYNPATNPQTYAVYLNVRKPFDTRDPKIRKIWQEEFYDHYSRTPLSDKGLPDWTDGIDLVEFIEDNEYDYDAIILDEGAVSDNPSGAAHRLALSRGGMERAV